MMHRQVPRAVTEAAEQYLHATYLEYAKAAKAAIPVVGRVHTSNTALGTYDSRSASIQGCFLRMISVVEAYVDIVLASLLCERAPTTDDLVLRLVEQAEMRASTTWSDRKDAFNTYFNIRLGQLARWSELDAGIEVRNAIAHGLGQLTFRQRNGAAARKISNIGVATSDGRVVIRVVDLERCLAVCIEFIRDLDETAQTKAANDSQSG